MKKGANLKRVNKEFNVEDHVYLRVKRRKRSLMLGSSSKMEKKYYVTFEVLDRIGLVAYRIGLSYNMRDPNVLHVSLLNNYVHDPNHIIDWNVIHVEPEGEFQVDPMRILEKR